MSDRDDLSGVVAELASWGHVSVQRMFGTNCLMVDNKMFAFASPGGLVVKLPDAMREQALVLKHAAPYHHGGRGPSLEVEEGGVGALGGAARIPGAGHGADAPYLGAADHPKNVEVVGSLTVHDASASSRLKLLGYAAPVEPVRVVPAVDHPQRAQRPTGDDLADLRDHGLVALGVPHHQEHAGALRGPHRALRILEGERHRLRDDDVLATLDGKQRVGRVQWCGGADEDGVHVGAGT